MNWFVLGGSYAHALLLSPWRYVRWGRNLEANACGNAHEGRHRHLSTGGLDETEAWNPRRWRLHDQTPNASPTELLRPLIHWTFPNKPVTCNIKRYQGTLIVISCITKSITALCNGIYIKLADCNTPIEYPHISLYTHKWAALFWYHYYFWRR